MSIFKLSRSFVVRGGGSCNFRYISRLLSCLHLPGVLQMVNQEEQLGQYAEQRNKSALMLSQDT